MNWIKLTPDNIPEYEVLAACFNETGLYYKDKLVGFIHYYEEKKCFKGIWDIEIKFCCASSNGIRLPLVTHYIKLPPQPFDL